MTLKPTVCVVTELKLSSSLEPISYLIGSAAKYVPLPTYSQVPDCQEAVTYQVSSPSSLISVDEATKSIKILGSVVTQAGELDVSITGTAAVS